MHSPAGLAKDEVSDVDDVCDSVRGRLTTLPALDCFLVFHDPILLYFGVGVVVLNALIWQVLKVFFGLSALFASIWG